MEQDPPWHCWPAVQQSAVLEDVPQHVVPDGQHCFPGQQVSEFWQQNELDGSCGQQVV
jgi:hypothetical protein